MSTERLVRVCLASTMLLVGAPAWKHSHPGGDRPHSHAHGHDHEHEGETHSHIHVTLFGVEFTLPADSDDCDDEEGQPTYLIADTPNIAIAHASALFVAPAQPLCLAEPLQIVPSFRPKTAIAAPLCDTARHERSGVQLI